MNGIKFIREKSNFSRNALAERMGVTRQTVTLWERGVRKPDKSHLKWLCDFYGVEEKWFGELSDDDIMILKVMKMYRHYDGEKEYFSFIPEKDGWAEISIPCGELDDLLDERYANVLKKKKNFIQHIENYLECKYNSKYDDKVCLFDKICTAERGMKDIERYLTLMETVQGVGTEGSFLKVPFRYEIKTVLYAMMVASGQYTAEEIKSMYEIDFEEGGLHIDSEYMAKLIELMRNHWTTYKRMCGTHELPGTRNSG
ncbi:MAG: helix-turn-helix transcriptional regulator [Blautia sp.]|nr:helix-turn-helix transcriptional regulator [Blautia sp.]